MTELEQEIVKAMREFIERQGVKLGTIQSSEQWRMGYSSALEAMSRVLTALTSHKQGELYT